MNGNYGIIPTHRYLAETLRQVAGEIRANANW